MYGDMPLGTTDATVVAVPEHLGVREVATLDRRRFSVVEPSHVDVLTLLLSCSSPRNPNAYSLQPSMSSDPHR